MQYGVLVVVLRARHITARSAEIAPAWCYAAGLRSTLSEYVSQLRATFGCPHELSQRL